MKQTDPETIRRLQLGNIKCLLRHRYGPTLPDDDAGREDLFELLSSVSLRAKAPTKVMRNVIETWAPWMAAAEAHDLVQRVELTPPNRRYRTAESLGQKFNVTNAERARLRLWLIAPVDVSQSELDHWRTSRRRRADRLRKERKRREAGCKTRQAYIASSLSRQKPWEAEGISRRTWERRRKAVASVSACSTRGVVASVSANKLYQGSGQTCDTETAARPIGLPRGVRRRARPHNADGVWTDTGAAP